MIGTLSALAVWLILGMSARAQEPVDVQLLIAADVSESMHLEIGKLQRQGYATALRSQAFAEALAFGRQGRIALAYIEWGDSGRVEVVVPWTLVDSPEAARAFARQLDERRVGTFLKTSISHALGFGHRFFDNSGFDGPKVIDISGNGPNNQGGGVQPVRDRLVADGVTINGLPIMAGATQPRGAFDTGFDLRELDSYFRDCVIGGPGAFMLPVWRVEDFLSAIQRKLILEIAGLQPETVVPAQLRRPAPRFLTC